MVAKKGSVWPFMFGGISETKLFEYLFGEADLFGPEFYKGKTSDHPSLLFVFFYQFPLLNFSCLQVRTEIPEERLCFRAKENGSKSIGKFLLS